MRILCIGNSFSEDATRFLHRFAASDGYHLDIDNLYIGGCSLERHWQNLVSGEAVYDLIENGERHGKKVSLNEMVGAKPYDFVTMQQVSAFSGIEASYHPYIEGLSGYLRVHLPTARQLFHETWAFETDSTNENFFRYGNDQKTMHAAIHKTVANVTSLLGIGFIPCGDVIQALRATPRFDYANGGQTLCRDGFHMDLIYGRYALTATWYYYLTGNAILENSFIPSEQNAPYQAEPSVLREIRAVATDIVDKTVGKGRVRES